MKMCACYWVFDVECLCVRMARKSYGKKQPIRIMIFILVLVSRLNFILAGDRGASMNRNVILLLRFIIHYAAQQWLVVSYHITTWCQNSADHNMNTDTFLHNFTGITNVLWTRHFVYALSDICWWEGVMIITLPPSRYVQLTTMKKAGEDKHRGV
jgi:hypothetical protein